MKTRLPGLPTVAALMLIAILVAWLGISGPIDATKVEHWQTLIAAAVTAIGIIVAAYISVRNVTKQIRISILSREEDRIERELPGLREARYFCSGFLSYRVTRTFHGLADAFRNDGFGGSAPHKDIEIALPHTDQATRQLVQIRLNRCFRLGLAAESMMKTLISKRESIRFPPEWEPDSLRQVQDAIRELEKLFSGVAAEFEKSMNDLENTVGDFDQKIALYEQRSARIRKEIAVYFSDSD